MRGHPPGTVEAPGWRGWCDRPSCSAPVSPTAGPERVAKSLFLNLCECPHAEQEPSSLPSGSSGWSSDLHGLRWAAQPLGAVMRTCQFLRVIPRGPGCTEKNVGQGADLPASNPRFPCAAHGSDCIRPTCGSHVPPVPRQCPPLTGPAAPKTARGWSQHLPASSVVRDRGSSTENGTLTHTFLKQLKSFN